jgi:hypothetical protein
LQRCYAERVGGTSACFFAHVSLLKRGAIVINS